MNAASGLNYWDAFLPSLVILALAAAVLPWFDRNNPWVRAGALSLCVFLSWRYMLWRLFDTIPSTDEPLNFLVGTIFTGVEALSMVGTTLTELFLSRVRNRSGEADRNAGWLASLERPPRVDILICTFNEEEDILEPTILGARALNYPNFRIWVCDDGKRTWLRDLCVQQGVHYLTRPDNAHAKAGNVNAALKVLGSLEERPDFVAILDADFVPMSDFLTRALSLTREPDVGIVQTPQNFFNPDPVQNNLSVTRVWPDEQRFFFDIVMASKDAWGVAFCCGTSSIIRFEALEKIGGFPTDSVTEDYLLTLRMREKGFRTVYLNEVLSLGLAPEGLKEYYGQRSRWCLGAVQIFCGPSSPLNLRNGLPFIDRVSLIDTFLFWSASHTMRLLAFVVPALYLLFGVQSVTANVMDAVSYVAPFIVVQLGVLLWLTEGRILPIMSDLYGTLCATEVVKAVVSGLFRPKGQKFKVTAKGGDRSQRIVQWPVLRIFLFYLLLNMLGIANTFLFHRSVGLTDTSTLALIWSWYNIVILVLACYVCIEQPQRRYRHRFPISDVVAVKTESGVRRYAIRDISVSGVRLVGNTKPPVGTTVAVKVGEFVMRADVIRVTEDGFALGFEPTLKNRADIVGFIFSKRYRMTGRRIRPGRVAVAIGARLFR
jgi:cellulose synthase/poly-beta-1,6-N-acetylglucosamine synthase-like glycosyltransferase